MEKKTKKINYRTGPSGSIFSIPKKSGLSIIDVIIGTALVSIIFLGIFGLFRLGTTVVGKTRAQITAVAIANQYIEKTRSLPYESVGVQGGFPEGILEPATTTIRNNIVYTIQNRVDYVIDATDGIIGAEDSCPNDYKKVEVTVSWEGKYQGEETLTTDIAPKNLAQECEGTGGILSVSVFDAYVEQVLSPLIEIRNPENDQLLKSATPDSGHWQFFLNSSTSYKVVVSKPGFSSERTYGISEVTTPEKPHLWVFENQLTESNFFIDETSVFSVDTSSPWSENYFYDSFFNTNKVSSFDNVIIGDSKAELSKNPGVYFEEGTTDGNLCSFPGDSGDCAQSFTMKGQNKQVSQIELLLRKATSTPSNIYLEIRTASTTGQIISSSTIRDGSSLPINLEWITFNLHSPATLTAYNQYFLRLRSIPDSVNGEGGGPVNWGYLHSSTSPPGYQGGDAFRFVGVNQEKMQDYDFAFKIYEDDYVESGSLTSVSIFPADLKNWKELFWTDTEPPNTELKYQIFYASNTDWLLIPDSDLPGNSSGFDFSPLNLSSLNTEIYSQLRLRANLSSNDPGFSPSLKEWQLSWISESATPIPNVDFLLHGEKLIGTDQYENPVYKYSSGITSDSNGHVNITGLEWDSYTFSLPTSSELDLISTDPSSQPIPLLPDNTVQDVTLYLEANNSLLITVKDNKTLDPVFAASARLQKESSGYDQTQMTNEKGQTYFMPLELGLYDLDIEAEGYLATSTSINISGDEIKNVRIEQAE